MTTPLRLALVSAFPPGRQSLNEYGLHLARTLAEREDVAEIVVLADRLDEPERRPLPELDLGPKVRVERVWRFNSLGAGFAILRALRRLRLDGAVWNLQTATFGNREVPAALGLVAPAMARALGTPSGIIAHNLIAGMDLERTQLAGAPLRQAIVRAGGALVTRAMLAADYMTVTLRGYRDLLAARHPGAEVHLVPHGIFDTAPRDRLPLAERPLRIVTMGKFGTYKRLETLLEAFDLMRARPGLGDLELVIGGTDHPATPGYLDAMAGRRAGDRSVRFAGYVAEEDIPDFFGTARLSVFDYASTTGSSGVLHQTASYGALPVFPRIGDFVDLCEDEGLSGVHYAPLDAADMALSMEAALRTLPIWQDTADANARAAGAMPLSDVAAFHVQRLRRSQVAEATAGPACA
jgi:glycosyltransferase involved in cell wall biosynthesis